MKTTDEKIKKDVLDELAWQPTIDETQVGVIVDNGVVTLTGTLDSYAKKMAAEKAVKSVKGVKAVAEDIKIEYGNSFRKTDTEIAKSAANVLNENINVPKDKVLVKVDNGGLYLTGELKWDFQKNAAKKAVENIRGVKYVVNNIGIKQEVQPFDIQNRITKAFARSAVIDAKNINVNVDGSTVQLRGKVHSISEKDDARKAAYNAPGVYKVENELVVEF
jgi:osmotically-inducible protein OsmY